MNWWLIAAGASAAMSLGTFALYAWDKRAARLGRQRIRERTLHLWEACGGWPGAFAAQRLLRHKNAKPGYQLVFWMIGVFPLTLIVVLLLRR
jgi:uncharacterized membrane protein YsdA (DUF1294 family)